MVYVIQVCLKLASRIRTELVPYLFGSAFRLVIGIYVKVCVTFVTSEVLTFVPLL